MKYLKRFEGRWLDRRVTQSPTRRGKLENFDSEELTIIKEYFEDIASQFNIKYQSWSWLLGSPDLEFTIKENQYRISCAKNASIDMYLFTNQEDIVEMIVQNLLPQLKPLGIVLAGGTSQESLIKYITSKSYIVIPGFSSEMHVDNEGNEYREVSIVLTKESTLKFESDEFTPEKPKVVGSSRPKDYPLTRKDLENFEVMFDDFITNNWDIKKIENPYSRAGLDIKTSYNVYYYEYSPEQIEDRLTVENPGPGGNRNAGVTLVLFTTDWTMGEIVDFIKENFDTQLPGWLLHERTIEIVDTTNDNDVPCKEIKMSFTKAENRDFYNWINAKLSSKFRKKY